MFKLLTAKAVPHFLWVPATKILSRSRWLLPFSSLLLALLLVQPAHAGIIPPADNQPPTVTITSINKSYPVGSTVKVNVKANDPDGSVVKYQVYVNGKLVDTDPSRYTAHPIRNVQKGTYQLLVRVTDNNGATGEGKATFSVGTTDENDTADEGDTTTDDNADDNDDGADCNAAFEERGGRVIIEAESLAAYGDWRTARTLGGSTGSGYLFWSGNQNFNSTGSGKISTRIRINTAGTYRFQWRTRVGRGNDNTLHNDTWLRFPDAADFYGLQGSGRVYPKGSGRSPSPEGAGANGYFKVYRSGRENWTWKSKTSDRDAHDIYVVFDRPGVYTMDIAARSSHHAIDRIALFRTGVNGTDLALAQTNCSGTSDPVDEPTTGDGGNDNNSNCRPELAFPGGRIAMSFDGNQHDLDDVGALPMALAMTRAAGLKDKVAFVQYSNHVCNNNANMNRKMNESAAGAVSRLGYSASIMSNFVENKGASTQQFIRVINASTATNPLWIVAAGPMESLWRALDGADAAKLRHVSVVSHSSWNENHPPNDCQPNEHDWDDVKAFRRNGLTTVDIVDQNGNNGDNDFNTPLSRWTWLRDNADADLRWVYSRNQFTDKFDPSDAGMVYWLITGGPNGGNQKAGSGETQLLLENPCDESTPSTPTTPSGPSVRFVTPTGNPTVLPGYRLAVTVDAKSTDSKIDNVRLYIDDRFVRQENISTYDWGKPGSPKVDELRGLQPGTYRVRVVATDEKGAKGENSFTLTVRGSSSVLGGTAGAKSAAGSDPAFTDFGAVEVYPNPAGNTLFLRKLPTGTHRVTVFSPGGRQVLAQPVQDATRLEFSVADLPAGLYLIRLSTATGEAHTTRFVKQ